MKLSEISLEELVMLGQVIKEYEELLENAKNELIEAKEILENVKMFVAVNVENNTKLQKEILGSLEKLKKYTIDRKEIEKEIHNEFVLLKDKIKSETEEITKNVCYVKKNIVNLNNEIRELIENHKKETVEKLENFEKDVREKIKSFFIKNIAIILAIFTAFLLGLGYNFYTVNTIKKDVKIMLKEVKR
ncbi:MAG: hypothetical protein QXK45_07255 [Thermofilaceae archaeon]